MALNRTLRLDFRGNISCRYINTSFPVSKSVTDKVQRAVSLTLTDGVGPYKADILFHAQVRLINTFKVYDLDDYSMKDVFAEGLNFDAVKFVLIENTTVDTTLLTKELNFSFKAERGIVGPGGSRIIVEPRGAGISPESSSGSQEEGQFTFSTNGDVTFNFLLIGASEEQSSSSG